VRRPLLYAGLLLVLLGLMAGALLWRPWSRREAAGVERILVLPFAIRGDSTLDYLHEGMVDLLGSRLEAYGVLQVVDPAQLLAHLAEDDSAGLIPTPKPALARALAQRYDADLYLTGSVVRLGRAIEIAVVLHDRRGDTRATVRREAPDESALGQAVDAIARDLLGRRWSRPADRLLRLAAAETRSPEALRAYLAGERAFRQADYAEARAQFVAATEADSLFALGFYRLSVAGGWLGDSAAYLHGAERAEALADHLGARDAMLLRAYLAQVRGRVDDAERMYREIVTQYPDDAEAWYNLGEVLFHSNGRRGRPIGEAREPFERAAALLGPQAEPTLHLVSLRMLDGERASLVPALDSLLRLSRLDAARRASWTTLRAVASGDSADLTDALAALGRSTPGAAIVTAWAVGNYTDRFTLIDSVLEPVTNASVQPPYRAGSLGLMAHAAAARGAWPVARGYLDRLSAIDHATALETRGWLLAQPWIVASREERLVARATPLAAPTERYPPGTMHFTPSPRQQSGLRLFLAGLLALRVGDTVAAEAAAARLYSRPANSGGPAFSASLRAELALARHRPDRALEELDALEHARSSLPSDTPQYGSVRERLLRAQALSGVGRYQEAVGWFESCRVIFSYDFAWRGAGQQGLARAATAAADTVRARAATANAARLGLPP
jgi:tetratricopeptide (TPR) repeat protein